MDERSGEGDEEDEEEEEDFDELTQDEDEEEELSSEESVLSVPELQDTMKQLTWLAAERRLCEDGDSEDDQSLMSQEEEEEDDDDEDEDEEQKESSEGGRVKDELLSGETVSTGGPSGAGRGRGRRRPLRGLSRARQRPVENSSKLLQLLDQNLVENDPLRESKDAAFAQSYLSRVREALQDSPGQMEQFVSVLSEFGDVKDEDRVLILFRKLRCILSTRSDLLRDFSAFLHPEQALQCGLWEEQQAFERSRRFLRQLEISFVDNPSHYQKIIRALQTKADLSPHSISELKAQMEMLLKGHTHLQTEFWVFFDELRPLPARFSQFEETDWPGGSGEGGTRGSFEEVISPEEEEPGLKHRPITGSRQRKMDAKFKSCDWSSKSWPRLCPDVKLHSHRRKGYLGCHDNQVPGGGDTHRLRSLYEHTGPANQEVELISEWAECELSGQMRSGDEGYEEEENSTLKRRREESELPVPAHNVSLTASGEKKILWNREADRVILTMCQQEGANHSTFQAVSERLGNKTPSEVSGRFEDLMKLFRTAHTETPPTDPDQSEEVLLSGQS
ncbi:GON-4-like protein [Gouania willdenowi]|uniref:GON-4-like protein n=1 Tax=Gouania willdenowi TaxID=441366 RepID=UPI0010558615|nr:GON-4-like protein [Gouania willdenowi]